MHISRAKNVDSLSKLSCTCLALRTLINLSCPQATVTEERYIKEGNVDQGEMQKSESGQRQVVAVKCYWGNRMSLER